MSSHFVFPGKTKKSLLNEVTSTCVLLSGTSAAPCLFVVWTQKDFFSMSISVDCPFLETVIPKLRSYYFHELLPALSIESIV